MRWLDSITNSMDMNLSKLRESKEQGSLACSNPWGHEESDMTWQLNNNQLCQQQPLASPAPLLYLMNSDLSFWFSLKFIFPRKFLWNSSVVCAHGFQHSMLPYFFFNHLVMCLPLPLTDLKVKTMIYSSLQLQPSVSYIQ